MIVYILILLGLSPTPAHTPGMCTTGSSVSLKSATASTRDPPYACRGEGLVFNCTVKNGASIQWASEPVIPCDNPLSFTTANIDGDHKERGSYQSYLVSVARESPYSNFTSNLTFTPPESVNRVTIVCGDQLSSDSTTEAELTLRIIDVPVVPQNVLQYFINDRESCPNISVLIRISDIQHISTLTYKLNVSSSDGCILQECPMVLSPGQRIMTLTLLNGVNYTATLEVSNDCGSNSIPVTIQPTCEARATISTETPGIREVEVVNTAAVVAVAVAVVSTLVAVAVIALIAIIYWWKKVKKDHERKLQTMKDEMIENHAKELQELKDHYKKMLQEEQERHVLKLKGADVPRGFPALSGSRDTAPGATGEGASQVSFALPASPSEARNSLHMAARQGDLEKVKSLVDEGADIRAKNKDGVTPMHLAAERAHMDVVKYLVRERTADVNIRDDNGRTPLHNAAKGGYERTVECLVKEGAEVNIQDNDGRTPLHTAAGKGYMYTVKWLVKEGADVSIKDNDEMTPLHVAAEEGRYKIMGYLVSKGADINIKDNKGVSIALRWTPLHIAAREGHEHTLKSIVENGAAIDVKNDVGKTPLDVAVERGHKKTAEYLRRPGMSDVPRAAEVADVHFELVNFTVPELESVPQELPGKPGIKVWKNRDVIHIVVHDDNETMCDLQVIFDKVGDDIMGLKFRRTL